MTGFRKVNGAPATTNNNGQRSAFGRAPQQQQNGGFNLGNGQGRETSPPEAYINLYLPLANGERAKLGDKGIPLHRDNAVYAKLLDYINDGMTGEDVKGILIVEIGKPRDPNAEIDFDFGPEPEAE